MIFLRWSSAFCAPWKWCDGSGWPAIRAERDHVRERVERLLGQLDALEL
jgi:hypothetical protein